MRNWEDSEVLTLRIAEVHQEVISNKRIVERQLDTRRYLASLLLNVGVTVQRVGQLHIKLFVINLLRLVTTP